MKTYNPIRRSLGGREKQRKEAAYTDMQKIAANKRHKNVQLLSRHADDTIRYVRPRETTNIFDCTYTLYSRAQSVVGMKRSLCDWQTGSTTFRKK